MQTGAATVASSMEFPQKLKIGQSFDPTNPLLGIYQKKTPKNHETPTQKNICISMFIAALFTIAKIWKQPQCPSVDEWVKKAVVHLHNGILGSCKGRNEGRKVGREGGREEGREGGRKEGRKKILPFETVWMDLEIIILSEISQSERDKYHMISFICRI